MVPIILLTGDGEVIMIPTIPGDGADTDTDTGVITLITAVPTGTDTGTDTTMDTGTAGTIVRDPITMES